MQVAPSELYFIKLDEPNYRTQNDFGFAIVSVDDLDLGGNSKKCPGAVEFFIQSVVTKKRITLLDLRIFYFLLSSTTRITVPRTTLDLLLSPWTTSTWEEFRKNALGQSSFSKSVSRGFKIPKPTLEKLMSPNDFGI